MKKALRLALLSAMVLIMVLTGTVCFASGDSESVRFKDRFNDDYTELAVKGELSLGENTVSVNDGCYKFTAESAGYYGNYYPDDETATIMSVAKPSEDGIAEIWAAPEAFADIAKALEDAGIECSEAKLTRKPENTVGINDLSKAQQVLRLVECPEEIFLFPLPSAFFVGFDLFPVGKKGAGAPLRLSEAFRGIFADFVLSGAADALTGIRSVLSGFFP